MKQQEVFKKIGTIIKELNEQYEYLQVSPDNLNDLELELFVANTHFLKDHAEILRKLNLQKLQVQHTLPAHTAEKQPEEKKPLAAEPKYFEPVVQPVKPIIEQTSFKPDFIIPAPPKPVIIDITPVEEEQPAPQIDLSSERSNDTYSYTRQEPETIRHELVLDSTDTSAAEDTTEQKETVLPFAITLDKAADETEKPHIIPTNPEPVIDNTPKTSAGEPVKTEPVQPAFAAWQPVVNEPAKPEPVKQEPDPVLTLNQRMSAQLRANQGNAVQTTEAPIQDIKAAISLNDKLLFVKDLFNGYNLAYSEAIEILNRFGGFDEADRFLKTNYVVKNNWESKQATVDKFYALLRRRYA